MSDKIKSTIRVLKKTELFSTASDFLLMEIAEICRHKIFNAGDKIFNKGDDSDALYIILEGLIEIHDTKYSFATLKKGQIIGEYSLLDDEPRSASATSVTNSKVLKLDKSDFQHIVEISQDFSISLLKLLSQRLRKQNQMVEYQSKSYIKIGQERNKILLENEKLEEESRDLNEQQQFILSQGDKVSHQKLEITESIQYSKKIQNAMMPPRKVLDALWPEHFIFYKAKEIVSGDFYWTFDSKDRLFFAAADCTGHGIPGAFMCMLGITSLNQIATHNCNEITAGGVLDRLRNNVINTLHQKREDINIKNGMDISLCIFDKKTNKMQWAGAYNPLLIINNNEITEIKADRMPIAIHDRDNIPFTNHYIDLQGGETLYLFSDGFADQFGSVTNKKFGKQRLRELLLSNYNKSMDAQEKIYAKTFKEWKGAEKQLDDVLLMGLRF